MIGFHSTYHSLSSRRCSGCQKKRSLRTDSFFAEFPKVALGTLLRVIFYFVQDDSQKRISQTLNLTQKLVSQICRRLQDICSRDLAERPFIPFGGPGTVVKCDESKFNHKAKVKYNFLYTFCCCWIGVGSALHEIYNTSIINLRTYPYLGGFVRWQTVLLNITKLTNHMIYLNIR